MIGSLVQVEKLDLAVVRNRCCVAPTQLPQSGAVEGSYAAKIKDDVLMPPPSRSSRIPCWRGGQATSVIRPDTSRITAFVASPTLVVTLISNLQLSPC